MRLLSPELLNNTLRLLSVDKHRPPVCLIFDNDLSVPSYRVQHYCHTKAMDFPNVFLFFSPCDFYLFWKVYDMFLIGVTGPRIMKLNHHINLQFSSGKEENWLCDATRSMTRYQQSILAKIDLCCCPPSADFCAQEGVSSAADDGDQATQRVTSHSSLSTS